MTGTVRDSAQATKDVVGKLHEIEVRYAWDQRDRLRRRAPRDIPHEYSASDRDRPLGFHWRVDEDAIRSLGLPPRGGHYAAAYNATITETVMAAEEGRAVSYSRNRNFYTGMTRYCGTSYTYGTVLSAVDEGVRAGLFEEWRQRPGSNRKWQSTFWATSVLLEAWDASIVPAFEQRETIRLRDDDGELIGYPETRETTRMRRELMPINEAIASTSITMPEIGTTTDLLWAISTDDGTCFVRPRGGVFRVFNRSSFSMGGRAYGWWQNIPKQWRAKLTINGKSTAELDYKALHPTMLYAERGLSLVGDPYEIDGYARADTKRAFLVAINARTTGSAIGAIADELQCPRETATELLAAVKRKHSVIADAFGSDAGIKLMRKDSEIVIDAVKACLKAGINALPVHDSLIVAQRHASRTAEIMVAEFAKVFPRINPPEVKT